MTSTTTLNEVEQKFAPKKSQSVLLSESYGRLHYYKRSASVSRCGSFLQFLVSPDGAKLTSADFCKDRLCPMCAWRRALKIYSNVSAVMDVLGSKYRYIFLTLTVPNCSGDELGGVIDNMQKAWIRLLHRSAVKKIVLGYFRALEITRNMENGTYHPHFHVVLAVSHSYFQGKLYIQQSKWLSIWRRSMKDDSITQVDVRTMKDKITGSAVNLSSAVAESAKYAVKSADYIFKSSPVLTDTIVKVFADVLYKRRLICFGGVFAEAREALELDDEENGDLVHINDSFRDDLATMILTYHWSAGAYKLISKEDYHMQ